MNTILLAATLFGTVPAAPSADLHILFDVQQQEIRHEIQDEMRASLQRQSEQFFAVDGELRRQLAMTEVRAELAVR